MDDRVSNTGTAQVSRASGGILMEARIVSGFQRISWHGITSKERGTGKRTVLILEYIVLFRCHESPIGVHSLHVLSI